MRANSNTKTRALIEAQGLLQTYGYNGFSFQHLADAVGVKKPSLFEHFESKEALGSELIKEYARIFEEWTETIAGFEPDAQIGALFDVFLRIVTNKDKLCAICAMSADSNALPKSMRQGLKKLYEARHSWIKKTIAAGQKQNRFRKDETPETFARLVAGLGLGAQLGARITGDETLIRTAKAQALSILRGSKS